MGRAETNAELLGAATLPLYVALTPAADKSGVVTFFKTDALGG